ncbi:RHS repeat-associated core domain-containing protein [Corallococcus sp. AB038B]|uniref:RHS repeat-associated core domain-containing protein n=1 Tax=Corallococcus sp. AB038B TaxID=2316718 RepID=UPI000EBB2991|nr:RHS repeat-associated core domain-containing protein [Corallococcus sp. AB038B]RKH98181.1 RHS repeat-associated core domain-containing protein [Corallococcus sp. AB038B]
MRTLFRFALLLAVSGASAAHAQFCPLNILPRCEGSQGNPDSQPARPTAPGGAGYFGDPVSVSDGYNYLRHVDFELPLSQGSLPFIRMYATPASAYQYSRLDETGLAGYLQSSMGKPFGEHRTNTGSVNWWHNFYSSVYKARPTDAAVNIRDVDGHLNVMSWNPTPGTSGRWYTNHSYNLGNRDQLWQDTSDGGWPQQFVYYREGSGRYVYDSVLVLDGGTGRAPRHYFLSRIEDAEYASDGGVEVARAVLEYALPSTDGGTLPDPSCPGGQPGSTPGVPYLRTITTRDGAKLHFYYRSVLGTFSGKDLCVLDHVTLEDSADGGVTEKTLVQYGYAPNKNELVDVTYPQTGGSRKYVYSRTSSEATYDLYAGGAQTGQLKWGTSELKAWRDVSEGHDYAITIPPKDTSELDACTLAGGRPDQPTMEFADSLAGLGTGASGATTFTNRFISGVPYDSSWSWRLHTRKERCDGTSCPGVNPGTERWEYECATTDSTAVPAMPKAHKDLRDTWTAYSHVNPDAGVAIAQGFPLRHVKELRQVTEGATSLSGTGGLAQLKYGYTYGGAGRSLRAFEQLLERKETASVLAPSGVTDPNARTQYVYDSVTNRLNATFRTGWTQVRDSSGNWQVEKRRVAVFNFRANQCGGVGPEDAEGRVLEVHGPCLVDASVADVSTLADCPSTTPFPVTKYEYWPRTDVENRRNKLKKESVFPGGCGGSTSLDTQYLEYDFFGNATRIQDSNGVMLTREFNQDLLAKQSVVDGSTTTTTELTYDQGRLKAIKHPQGNYDVLCFRSGTTSGCSGGTLTKLLQWKATAADVAGSSWSERVDYTYWPDETLKSETFQTWTGSTAQTRRVKTYAADARKHPTYEGMGTSPSPVQTARVFDSNGNLTGLGFSSNAPPAVCGGVNPDGSPVSTLCTAMGYDRLNRLTKVDEFPTSGRDQRTCFTHDVQNNVTSVRAGCAVASGSNDCSTCSSSVPASTYGYDDFGNLVTVSLPHTSDGAGGAGVTRYAYDARGSVTVKETPEMRATWEWLTYEYDLLGRPLRSVRHFTTPYAGAENLFALSYDVNDSGDATSVPPASCPQPVKTAGRLRYRHDSFGRTWYQYDAFGQVAGEIRLREGETGCSSGTVNDHPHTFYTYTANGNVETVTYPHGRVITYVYGTGAKLNRTQAIDVRLFGTTGYTDTRVIEGIVWEPYGNLRGYQMNHPATSNSSAFEFMLGDNTAVAPAACPTAAPNLSSGDMTGRLRSLRVSSGPFSPGAGNGDIYQRGYTWTGDQVARLDTCLLGATTPRTETYAYDRTLRLVGAGRPTGNFAATGGAFDSRTYQYDGRGNRTQMEEDGFIYDLSSGTAPAVDQLTGWGSSATGSLLKYTLSHDVDGRVTQKRWAATMSGGPVYTLGFEYGQTVGVATEIVFRAVNINGTYYNYFYDALGRRRLKSNPYGTTDEYFHSVTSRLLTDRGNNGLGTPIGHFTLDDYVWLAGRPVALVRGKFSAAWARQPDGTGDCARDGESVACGVYFPVTDHIGKPVVMLDASRRVTGAADSDPFGHVNRVSYHAETAHPYAHNTSTTLASFSQPKENTSVQVRMRARYHVVDTEPGVDFVHLVDSTTSGVLDSQSGARRGRVTTSWVTPSNGSVAVSFASNASGLTSYQGVSVEGYEYQRYQTGAQAFWISLGFPGQYRDAETDLVENWNRYYDPDAGRYLQLEPMQYESAYLYGMARSGFVVPAYTYALGNPIGFFDPNGLYIKGTTSTSSKFIKNEPRANTLPYSFPVTSPCTKRADSSGRQAYGYDASVHTIIEVRYPEGANPKALVYDPFGDPSVNNGEVTMECHEKRHVADAEAAFSSDGLNGAIATEGFDSLSDCERARASFGTSIDAYHGWFKSGTRRRWDWYNDGF